MLIDDNQMLFQYIEKGTRHYLWKVPFLLVFFAVFADFLLFMEKPMLTYEAPNAINAMFLSTIPKRIKQAAANNQSFLVVSLFITRHLSVITSIHLLKNPI